MLVREKIALKQKYNVDEHKGRKEEISLTVGYGPNEDANKEEKKCYFESLVEEIDSRKSKSKSNIGG